MTGWDAFEQQAFQVLLGNAPSAFETKNEDPKLVEHLKNCENCSALVRDLQYIADQASLLLQPTHEPSDNVWKRIQEGIDSDRAQNPTHRS